MHKETVVDQIEIRRDGTVQVRFGFIIVNDNGTLAADPKWHRAAFDPSSDIEAGLNAVKAHFIQMGEALPDMEELQTIFSHAQVARTPIKVAAHAERMAKEKQERDAKIKAKQ